MGFVLLSLYVAIAAYLYWRAYTNPETLVVGDAVAAHAGMVVRRDRVWLLAALVAFTWPWLALTIAYLTGDRLFSKRFLWKPYKCCDCAKHAAEKKE